MKNSWLNQIYKRISFILLIVGMFSTHVHAATEFLRFEGAMSLFYDDDAPENPAPLGLAPNQSVHFDFQIDTDLNVLGLPDTEFISDYFAVTYIAGSIAGAKVTHGVTTNFPEGLATQIFIIDYLRVGMRWDSLDNTSDESISTWNVGDNIPLLYTDTPYFTEEITIANLEMAYRGVSPPQAIVPIPATVWLFVSGLIGLIGIARRKKA